MKGRILSLLLPAVLLAGEVLASAPAPLRGAGADSSRTLAEWYGLGGFIMHLLVACSVLAGAIVLERLYALRRSAVCPRALARDLVEAWDRRRMDVARGLCDASPSSLSRLVRAGISAIQRGAAHPLEHVAASAEAESLSLRRNLPLLASVANVATMLGLLGTVIGMIQAFDQIAEVGVGDARVVARGIFQALVTTAAGLCVGIAALAAHAALRRRVDAHLLALEEAVNRLFEGEASSGSELEARELAAASP